MRKPFISIIIPTYNRLFSLGELIEALSRQTFGDFEVIIVNDCGEKVDIIKELYPNLDIQIVEMEQHSYHVQARNKGVEQSKGELIMLIDDDDLIVPTHMETMVKEIAGYDLVYSDVEIVQFQLQNHTRIPVNRLLFAYQFDLKAMRSFSTFVPSGCLYRKELHQMVGMFDPEVHHYWDWDFFLRVADHFKIKRVPIAGVLYDFSDYNPNQSKDFSAQRQSYLDRLSEKHHLGSLPTENFFTLLQQPAIKERKAESKIVWDGEPIISRLKKESLPK
jgi:glycosyltransferase involved in cell wall biosynthesis